MKRASLMMISMAIFLTASLSWAADQTAFDALIQSLGKSAEDAAKVTDPKLRTIIMAGLSQRQLELAEFLKQQGEAARDLKLTRDPLGDLRTKWEGRNQLFLTKQDDLQKVLDLCDTLTKPFGAPNPIEREVLLQRIEKLLRREGIRQGAIPDPHWIWVYPVNPDPEASKEDDSILHSDFLFPKLEAITDLFIKDLRGKVIRLRESNLALAGDNAVNLGKAHDEYMTILGRAGLFPQGTYVGTVQWGAGNVAIAQGDQSMKFDVPPRPVAQLKLIVSGVNVSGLLTIGEGDSRSSGRMQGRFDPVAWKLNAKPIDAVIKVPGATSTRYDTFQFQGIAEQRDLFRGDWELDVTIAVTSTDENGNEVSGTIRVAGRGSWEAKLPKM